MKRYALVIAVSIIVCSYLNAAFFTNVNIFGIRPDAILALIVSIGVLLGGLPASIIGLGVGLMMDVFFNKIVGLSAIAYIVSGIAGGIFYKKFYADNVIIPAATAVVSTFFKEHILCLAALLAGARFNYGLMLVAYILPCCLLTGGICILIHMVMKSMLVGKHKSIVSQVKERRGVR